MFLCKHFFSSNTFLQTIFFPIFYNHVLTKKEVPFLLPSIIIHFTAATNELEKEKSAKRIESTNHCPRTLPFDTSEVIFFVF